MKRFSQIQLSALLKKKQFETKKFIPILQVNACFQMLFRFLQKVEMALKSFASKAKSKQATRHTTMFPKFMLVKTDVLKNTVSKLQLNLIKVFQRLENINCCNMFLLTHD